MKKRRGQAAWGLIKGIIAAAILTLIGMLILAAAIIFTGMGDNIVRVLNQVLKAVSVVGGTYLAVGRGGERGLLTGAGIGAGYAIIGYVMYIFLGGYDFMLTELMGEILIASAAGAASGAVFANLSPRGRKAKKA